MCFILFLTGVLWKPMPNWFVSARAKSMPLSTPSCWTCCRKDFHWHLNLPACFFHHHFSLQHCQVCVSLNRYSLSITPLQTLPWSSLPLSSLSATANHVSVVAWHQILYQSSLPKAKRVSFIIHPNLCHSQVSLDTPVGLQLFGTSLLCCCWRGWH